MITTLFLRNGAVRREYTNDDDNDNDNDSDSKKENEGEERTSKSFYSSVGRHQDQEGKEVEK